MSAPCNRTTLPTQTQTNGFPEQSELHPGLRSKTTAGPRYGMTVCLICDKIKPANCHRINLNSLDEYCPECNRAMYGVLGTEIIDA